MHTIRNYCRRKRQATQCERTKNTLFVSESECQAWTPDQALYFDVKKFFGGGK